MELPQILVGDCVFERVHRLASGVDIGNVQENDIHVLIDLVGLYTFPHCLIGFGVDQRPRIDDDVRQPRRRSVLTD